MSDAVHIIIGYHWWYHWISLVVSLDIIGGIIGHSLVVSLDIIGGPWRLLRSLPLPL